MLMGQIAVETQRKAISVISGITRLAKLERSLALLCVIVPLGLIWIDNWSVRDSISAYYNMSENQFYYFPLTVLAMLFIVNGVVKEKQIYNTVLGVALSGVILFNHSDATILHFVSAALFFGGNALVVLVYSSRKEMWFRTIIVIGILIAMIGHFAFHWFALLWAEWFSFFLIAVHYIIESWHDDKDMARVVQAA